MKYIEILEQKGKEYALFDPQRFPKVFAKIKADKKAKIVQLIGTNGKGTTGRCIAEYLFTKGLDVAHFSSPHIQSVHERFWRNQKHLDDVSLEMAHTELVRVLTPTDLEALSYFEYLTLLGFFAFRKCDYFVLEAGLGGEFDSTSSLPIDLQLFTKIAIDHCEFLGESLEEIATTKLNAVKAKAVIGFQEFEQVRMIAKTQVPNAQFLDEKNLAKEDFIQKGEPLFLGENRALAFVALEQLGFSPKADELVQINMFGRLTQLRENIYLDVGHNLSAAKAIGEFFQGKKVIIIYNSYKEKDFLSILSKLKPMISKLLYLPLEGERVANKEDIFSSCKSLDIAVEELAVLEPDKTYLVFGSFLCVEKFLRVWECLER